MVDLQETSSRRLTTPVTHPLGSTNSSRSSINSSTSSAERHQIPDGPPTQSAPRKPAQTAYKWRSLTDTTVSSSPPAETSIPRPAGAHHEVIEFIVKTNLVRATCRSLRTAPAPSASTWTEPGRAECAPDSAAKPETPSSHARAAAIALRAASTDQDGRALVLETSRNSSKRDPRRRSTLIGSEPSSATRSAVNTSKLLLVP